MTYEDFVIKARKKHGDKYQYPYFDNHKSTEKITIICPEHGEFTQNLYAHLKGQGCPKCSMNQKLTTEEFLRRVKLARGDEFDYSKTVYINRRTKVCVIDKNGNELWKKPECLLKPTHVRQHRVNRRYHSTDEYVGYVSKLHNDKYDYSKTVYTNINEKITIICPEHGEFTQTANSHAMGHGCPYCSKNKKMTISDFIERAKKKHGDKYDYSNVVFNNCDDKVCIICPEHGEFWQNAQHHIQGHGCPKCAKNKKLTTEEFIERAKKIHGDKYDYSKTVYINLETPVTIICSKHGEFKQIPSVHLTGNGCPLCHESRMESSLTKKLKEFNIVFIKQYKPKWLNRQSIDFFIPSKNIAIECQGIQHFQNVEFFNNTFKYTSTMDIKKYSLCENNNIKIYYLLPNRKIDYTIINKIKSIYTQENTFYSIDTLIDKIKRD